MQTADPTDRPPGPQWPYGIDPRQYGLGKLDYQEALRHHRSMEDSARRLHESQVHSNEMAEADAKRAAAEAELAARQWYLQPICSLFKWFGGACWIVMWFYVIGSILLSISEWQAKRDANWCLKDIAKCERISKGEFK